MKTHPAGSDAASNDETAAVVALRHQFRNRIQTMTSLVGLFGRRLQPGDARRSFEDLRARFEAVAFGQDGNADLTDPADPFSLAEFARRVAGFVDPAHLHRLDIVGGEMAASARRSAVLAQITAELLIDLYRAGFDEAGACTGEIRFEPLADGGLKIRVARTGPAGALGRNDPDDLGLTLARSMTASLGGDLSRSADGPLALEAVIPPETARS